MREIMISIQPQWVEKILNKEKTIEIRKTKPNCELPCRVYIYCTKSKTKYLRKLEAYNKTIFITENKDVIGATDKVKSILGEHSTFIECGGFNGKVVAEFTLKNVVKFDIASLIFLGKEKELMQKSCIGGVSLREYLGDKIGYTWGIDNLKIYDKPKELGEFTHNVPDYSGGVVMYSLKPEPLKRPSQSWCYVEENL